MRRAEDEGFTLIELMVVVLIIAILLAIAIPSFLGARERAADRSAQSNVRNAHTTELVFYSDHQVFTTDSSSLAGVDASLQYRSDLTTLQRGSEVYVETSNVGGADKSVLVAAKSATGRCFWIRTLGDNPQPRFAVDNCSGTALVFEEKWNL